MTASRSEGGGNISQIMFFAFLYACAAGTLYTRQKKGLEADVAAALREPHGAFGDVLPVNEEAVDELGFGPLTLQQHLTIFTVAFLSGTAMNTEVFWPLISCVA